MAQVTIYTKSWCPYCQAAKELLTLKKVAFEEIDAADPLVQAQMSKRAGGRSTVPQIFIDGAPIGGCDDLYALDKAGRLDTLLAA